MALLSSNLATNSRFVVSDFLSDIGKVSKGYMQIGVFPFDTFPISERKSETTKLEFVARLLLRSAIRMYLGRQEGLEQTHSIFIKVR